MQSEDHLTRNPSVCECASFGWDLTRFREWGRENGYKVSSRGRVSQELQDAYAAAH